MHRRAFLCAALAVAPVATALGQAAGGQPAPEPARARLHAILDQAEALTLLETVMVAQNGSIVAERSYRGRSTAAATNIKSASKPIISALVGIAIERSVLQGPEQTIAPLLKPDLPPNPDPRLLQITVGHLLSMQTGLKRTSGASYGLWVASRNWVRSALAQPFMDEPGGRMLYSTGSTHLLSAVLTRASNRTTLALARDWLGTVPDFAISDWERDPQGIYLGGNQMAMSPRSLLAFGELYRNGGRTPDGRQVVPQRWIALSWEPRTQSRFTGDAYGYGWFRRQISGQEVRYAWGYGGQMLYIVPGPGLTVVMTSDDRQPSGRTGYRDELHELLAAIIATFSPDAEE
jgi:CubicO group peptidase (beta-lactamase class C family)